MSSRSQQLINYSAAPSKIKLAPQPSSITFYGRPTNIESKMFFFIDPQFPVDISGHHLPFFILFKQPHSMVRKCRVIKFFNKILVQKMLESTRHMALQFIFFLQYVSCQTDRGPVMISIQNFALLLGFQRCLNFPSNIEAF
jgi:hypothetical protein